VQGVVVAEPGRILGDRTTCIQDASGGICVRLPEGVAAERGQVLLVDGPLAAPYGNLELRPAAGGVAVVGSLPLPAPRPLALAELGEGTEGLLARSGGIVRSISTSAAGAITLILDDGSSQGRIYIHAEVGAKPDRFARGQRLLATGIVGDRLGLYRLWPRTEADIEIGHPSHPPGPTPKPSTAPTARPSAGPTAPPSVSIAEALRRPGQKVTVEGVVSAPATLLDADGRRQTIQHGGAAILVRWPAGTRPVPVGQRVRVSGEVGTYYGAPQLAASNAPAGLGRGELVVTAVTRGPIEPRLEWQLVRVSGVVESVQRSGDAWRAEIKLAGGAVAVVGLARSGIGADTLVRGSQATVTGLVRRAYPTATDQRFQVVPRSPSDIRGGGPGSTPPPRAGSSPAPPGNPVPGPELSPGQSSPPGAVGPLAVDLADLAAREGDRVRVGGRLLAIEADRLLLDDGTAQALVRLGVDARPLIALLRRGTLINATGVITRSATGGLIVEVAEAGDVAIAGAWVGAAPSVPPATSPPPSQGGRGPLATAPDKPTQPAPDGLMLLLGALVAVGAVTGSATAFFARGAGARAALKEAKVRLRARLERLRARLAVLG